MARILILITLVWLLYRVFKHLSANPAANKQQEKSTDNTKRVMLCNQCGLHVPEDESYLKAGKIYCNNPVCKPKDDQAKNN